MSAAAPSLPPALQGYRNAFEGRWTTGDAFTALRRDALERFVRAGFPTQRNEDWKYTSLRRLESRQFAPIDGVSVADVTDRSQWIDHRGVNVVFVNGAWMQSLSSVAAQPPGCTILTLGKWLRNAPDEVAAFLSKYGSAAASALENLNTAFLHDGVVIEVSADAAVESSIYVLHQITAAAQQRMNHPRLFIKAGARSRCTVVEQYLGADDAEYFTNSVVSIEAAEGASVTHCRLQQESLRSFHLGTAHVRLQRDASYQLHDIALGAGLAHNSIVTTLEGPGATATLRGLFAPAGSQHIDTHTRIDHVAPHTVSHEEYRGIADGRGRGVFNGKVLVRRDAQHIDARQSSRNLLLSPTAEIDTKPELEIYANDVKCSHGATTGQLDATALFYLRSRGLSEVTARTLLIRAFAESIIGAIPCQPVRDYLEARLDARFATGVPT